jgi:hypothetical protein
LRVQTCHAIYFSFFLILKHELLLRKGKLRNYQEALHWGAAGETISPVKKVPKQCPFVLLVEIMHNIGIFM